MWQPAGRVRAASPGNTPRRRPQAQRRQGRARETFGLAPAAGERLWAAAWTFPFTFPLPFPLTLARLPLGQSETPRPVGCGFSPGRLPVPKIEAPGQTIDFHDARATVKDAKQSPAAPGPSRSEEHT